MARIVLVADDSPTIQKRALGILKGEGFEVETVSNGVAAIKRLAVLHPVVVLADVSMPGRDGYEVCDYVKKSPDLAHVPVLLVASDMEPYDSARGTGVGADGIIKKPFEAHELIAIVVKFAEQFEAATIATTPAPAAPPKQREITHEFSPFGQETDNAPTVVQQVDFSAHSEGVAFSEPTSDEEHPFAYEPPADASSTQFGTPQPEATALPESTFELPHAHVEDHPLILDATAAHSDYPQASPFFHEGLETAPSEPIFSEEPPPPAPPPPSTHSAGRTMIFRAPLEIAEPVWRDETAGASSAADSGSATALEPQFEVSDTTASSEYAHEHPHEHPHPPSAVSATSLDSFSLDDAAAGQIRFASEMPVVVYAAPEEPATTEPAVPEPPHEAVYAPEPVMETAPEVIYTEAVAAEPAPEVVYTQAAAPEPAPEAVHFEVAPTEAAPEVVEASATPVEAVKEPAHEEAVALEPVIETTDTEAVALEPVIAEAAPHEPAMEAIHEEGSKVEAAQEVIEPDFAVFESAPAEPQPEVSVPEPPAETAQHEVAPPEPQAEIAAHHEIAPPEPEPEIAAHQELAPPEPQPEIAAHHEIALPEPEPEIATHHEIAHAEPEHEIAQHEPVMEQAAPAAMGSLEAALEAFRAEIAHTPSAPAAEPLISEVAAVEPALEAIHTHDFPLEAAPALVASAPEPAVAVIPEPSPVAAPEPVPSPASFLQATLDKELVHTIIQKVVLKMAPPILTPEQVEEITKRLAEEIISAIDTPSSHPEK